MTAAVTVVVATRDRRERAMATVASLRALPEGPEVVVVDDGSTDGTACAIRDGFPDVTVIGLRAGRGVAAARNIGVSVASTPYVAFSDDDSSWAPGALAAIEEIFLQYPKVGLVAGRILVGEEETLDGTCAEMGQSPLSSVGLPGPRILGFVACAAAVRREAFVEVGGFPERYVIGGEERPLAWALAAHGWDLTYVEKAVAHHWPGDVSGGRDGRARRVTRNDLWTTWSRRSPQAALRRTGEIMRGADTLEKWAGVAEALVGLPGALWNRRRLPGPIEDQVRLLEGDRSPSRGGNPRIMGHRRLPKVLNPDLAVVVITHNRSRELLDSLDRLVALPERPHVVVVDNGSVDGTSEAVLSNHPEVELITLGENAGAVGRNVAVAKLSHPYVAFGDDDTWWEPGSLAQGVEVLERHPDVAVVTARIVVEPSGPEDPVVADMRDSPLWDRTDLPGRPLVSFLAGASVLRRSAFEQVGGFEPRLWIGGEEELLSMDLLAAGWQMRYIPEMTVHHAPSSVRDPHRRRRHGLRNTLWCTWLRRPPYRALRRTWRLLTRAQRDLGTVSATLEAVAGLPWVLRRRRSLPEEVEKRLRLIEDQQLDSQARRYIS